MSLLRVVVASSLCLPPTTKGGITERSDRRKTLDIGYRLLDIAQAACSRTYDGRPTHVDAGSTLFETHRGPQPASVASAATARTAGGAGTVAAGVAAAVEHVAQPPARIAIVPRYARRVFDVLIATEAVDLGGVGEGEISVGIHRVAGDIRGEQVDACRVFAEPELADSGSQPQQGNRAVCGDVNRFGYFAPGQPTAASALSWP